MNAEPVTGGGDGIYVYPVDLVYCMLGRDCVCQSGRNLAGTPGDYCETWGPADSAPLDYYWEANWGDLAPCIGNGGGGDEDGDGDGDDGEGDGDGDGDGEDDCP